MDRAAQLLTSANDRHLAGDLSGARSLYDELLACQPNHARAMFGLALLDLQAGEYSSALRRAQDAIASDPHEIRFYFGLGQILAEMKRYPEAEAAYLRMLEGEPDKEELHFALGRVRELRGDWSGAIEAYQAALQLRPDYADAINNLGNCHQMRGELARAEEIYRRALAIRPDYISALSNLGIVLSAMGQIDEAIGNLQKALDAEPTAAIHYANLGAVLCQNRKFNDAMVVLRRGSEIDGNSAAISYNLANALHGLGQLPEAIAEYKRAISLKGDYADAFNNLGNVYKQMREYALAASAYEAAANEKPSFVVALNNAACIHRILGKMDEAEETLRRALVINPNFSVTYNNLGNVLKDTGALDEAIECFRKSTSLDRHNSSAHSNLVYSLAFYEANGLKILEECRKWDALHGLPAIKNSPPWVAQKSGRRRMRIGYVSGDFREHCQSLFTIPLLSNHDHEAVEVFCYSSVERPDERTRQITGYADVWRDVRQLDDAELCHLIRRDHVDILVDLAMHMAGGRPGLFARRTAPVQVAWLAYPGTTGIAAMDVVLSDPWLAPPELENHYSEKVIRLPETFWCYDPLTEDAKVNDLPVLNGKPFTFGCLNAPYKISNHTMVLWGKIMARIPTARLLLLAPLGRRRQHLLDRLSSHGIAAERVMIQPFMKRSLYLQTYHQIDLALDTTPYNGHTTSLDGFWMGVPVVSLVIQTAVGRAGLSQLTNLGLPELAVRTEEEFVDTAVSLATDLPRLAKLRRELRQRMRSSPLMDGRRFARNIESAYRQMWTRKQSRTIEIANHGK